MNKTLGPYELHGDSGFHFETQNIFIDLQDVSKRYKILGGAGPYRPIPEAGDPLATGGAAYLKGAGNQTEVSQE